MGIDQNGPGGVYSTAAMNAPKGDPFRFSHHEIAEALPLYGFKKATPVIM